MDESDSKFSETKAHFEQTIANLNSRLITPKTATESTKAAQLSTIRNLMKQLCVLRSYCEGEESIPAAYFLKKTFFKHINTSFFFFCSKFVQESIEIFIKKIKTIKNQLLSHQYNHKYQFKSKINNTFTN